MLLRLLDLHKVTAARESPVATTTFLPETDLGSLVGPSAFPLPLLGSPLLIPAHNRYGTSLKKIQTKSYWLRILSTLIKSVQNGRLRQPWNLPITPANLS